MRKDHKVVKTILKEEKKEVKGKLKEANNVLAMLKKGLISIADIDIVFQLILGNPIPMLAKADSKSR